MEPRTAATFNRRPARGSPLSSASSLAAAAAAPASFSDDGYDGCDGGEESPTKRDGICIPSFPAARGSFAVASRGKKMDALASPFPR